MTEDANALLLRAAAEGRRDDVARQLNEGADPRTVDGFGNTPLHLAAIYGHVGVAETLLAAGGMVNARDADGATPLHHAAGNGHLEVVKLLVAKGADVNARTNGRKTPVQ